MPTTTTPHNLVVPSLPHEPHPTPGFYVQANGKDKTESPGGWAIARIWKDPAGLWHSEVKVAWDPDIKTKPLRLKEAVVLADVWRNRLGLSKIPIFTNADPLDGFPSGKDRNVGKQTVFNKLLDFIHKVEDDAGDDMELSNDSCKAEKLVYGIVSNDKLASGYLVQNTPGYDIDYPPNLHEVKSFGQSSPVVHFTSAQLDKMNDKNYFVWLVKKVPGNIKNWWIIKIPGDVLYAQITELAKGKFSLNCPGTPSSPYLMIGVKIKLNALISGKTHLKLDPVSSAHGPSLRLSKHKSKSSAIEGGTAIAWYNSLGTKTLGTKTRSANPWFLP
jgi:hypothetical protein